jgi:hypothetical protein
MRIKPAHQRLITDVSRLRPHRCAIIITTIRSPQLTESSRSACALTKDIRAIQATATDIRQVLQVPWVQGAMRALLVLWVLQILQVPRVLWDHWDP